jgi:hypothetical protein
MPQTIKEDPIKHCETCGVRMFRKRFGKRLEDHGVFLRRRNCSKACGNTKTEVTKDTSHWRARKHRAKNCADCGTTEQLHVHHKDRNHENNVQENLITLCASCHLKLHWREDREKRLEAARKAYATAVPRYGVKMRPRSTDGRWCSGEQLQRQPS